MIRHALVFTDLDGTLLDHHTYSFEPAKPALELLSTRNIPVILNSSKTLAEIEQIAEAIQLDTAIIAENGSLIRSADKAKPTVLGKDYAYICQHLDQLRTDYDYQFTGFHDWSAAKIAEVTGLPLADAERAGQREASEPLLWQDSDEALRLFTEQLQSLGLTLKRGGRFWHVMGLTDKVKAMEYLVDQYRAQHGEKPTVIALGDGPNDLEMIRAADIGIVIYNPDGTPLAVKESAGHRIIRTQQAGPVGWNAAITMLLEE